MGERPVGGGTRSIVHVAGAERSAAGVALPLGRAFLHAAKAAKKSFTACIFNVCVVANTVASFDALLFEREREREKQHLCSVSLPL